VPESEPYCRVFKRRNISNLTQTAFYEMYSYISASNKPVSLTSSDYTMQSDRIINEREIGRGVTNRSR
jgi:hypothetical protein